MPFAATNEALDEIQRGRMVVVVDDVERENEGDLVMAAEKVTPEAVNFMAKLGRGLICLALPEDRLDQLRIPLMTEDNTAPHGTAFCVCIDARDGVTTGISAADRARTIQVAMDLAAGPEDLVQPGHVPPLRARPGGVLARRGHSEAGVDLSRLAGLQPGGVICEIMNDDGTMARVPQLEEFCRQHQLKMITIAELIRYRLRRERHVHRLTETAVSNALGRFNALTYSSDTDGEHRVVLTLGDFQEGAPIALRMNARSRSARAAGGLEVQRLADDPCVARIVPEGKGAVVFLANPFSGTAISRVDGNEARKGETLDARNGQPRQSGLEYELGICAQILADLRLKSIRLIVEDPHHAPVLRAHGIEVVEHSP